jgi:hypothetical protein
MILGKLEKFRGKPEENVERWIGEYENHALVNRWDDSVKAIQIGCYLGKTAKAFYGTLDPVEKRDYTQVIAKLLGYFKHTSSSHYFYKKIRERTQQNNETVDQYAFSLATLCGDPTSNGFFTPGAPLPVEVVSISKLVLVSSMSAFSSSLETVTSDISIFSSIISSSSLSGT